MGHAYYITPSHLKSVLEQDSEALYSTDIKQQLEG
jgi:hypothetical protein